MTERQESAGRGQPRFVCDMMLGRLAKWLRLFGYDTAYFHDISDAALLRLAREEDRILLTRDTRLMDRRPIRRKQIRALLLRSDSWRSQLAQLAGELDLHPSNIHLCAVCNRPLTAADRDDIKDLVPPYVWQTQRDFRRCPACGRIYWPATHWDKIEAIKEGVLKGRTRAG